MAGELLAGIGLFKSMLDTARGLKDMNDTAVRNAAAIDLQEKILTAQAEQATLIERIGLPGPLERTARSRPSTRC